MSLRKDVYKLDVQEILYLLVFHKVLDIGCGTAVSLYVNNHEFLKFDCFGDKKGHFHIYDGVNNDTIYFDEKTCKEQINRSVYELIENITTYLHLSSNNEIKNFQIDMKVFKDKLEIVKNKMIEYEDLYYSSSR